MMRHNVIDPVSDGLRSAYLTSQGELVRVAASCEAVKQQDTGLGIEISPWGTKR